MKRKINKFRSVKSFIIRIVRLPIVVYTMSLEYTGKVRVLKYNTKITLEPNEI